MYLDYLETEQPNFNLYWQRILVWYMFICIMIWSRIFNFEKKCLQSLSQQLADDVARFHCTNCGQSSSFNFVESVEQDVSNHMNQDSPNMEQVKIFQN